MTCVMALVVGLAQDAPGKSITSPENIASGEFFAEPVSLHREMPPQPLRMHRGDEASRMKTVSGRRVWLSADPIKEDGGLNLYAYVNNDPINYWDPNGLEPLINMLGDNAVTRYFKSIPGATRAVFGETTGGVILAFAIVPFEDIACGDGKDILAGAALSRIPGGRNLKKLKAPKSPPNPGGRLGKESTRAHIDDVATEMERRGFEITGGGNRLPEEYLPGPGGGRKGSSFPDITATKNGRTVRVNTVDTRADGVTPSTREANNAARIRSQTPGDHLLLVPKPK